MTVAIIIARKGSQRCKGKNARLLCGKPLAEWSMIQARCSKLIDHVIVATDHEELAYIAEDHGCHLKWRTDVKDTDPGNVPFLEAMEAWERTHDAPDQYVTILPTSPLRMPDHFDAGLRRYARGDVESVSWAWLQKEYYPFHVVYKGDKPEYGFPCTFNKAWDFCTPFGGDGIWTHERYKVVSDYTIDHEGYVRSWRGFYGLVPVDQWQLGEVDTDEQFEDVEVMMKHRIIDRLGEDCYERYRDRP